jgi:uncharacterized membrane protein YciS (DUF1049 family)
LAYSIVGDFVVGLLGVLVPVVIFLAVIALLCFDRVVYVPAYRLARDRFRLNVLVSFCVAIGIEGGMGTGLFFAVKHRARTTKSSTPPSAVSCRHPTRLKARILTGALE